MYKPTPGPWRVDAGPFTNEGSFATMIMPERMGNQVASAFGWGDRELSLANARLIAAAPDLLAALQALVAGLPSFPDEPVGPDGRLGVDRKVVDVTVGDVRAARQAIAKATGATEAATKWP